MPGRLRRGLRRARRGAWYVFAVGLVLMALGAGLASQLLPLAEDRAAFRAAGIELTTALCERLISEGVPGLHFYTLNRSTATRQVVTQLGLAGIAVG